MSEADTPREANAATAVKVRPVVLWSAFFLCQAVSQAVHHWLPPRWWDAAKLLLAVTLALGALIIVQRRFSRGALVPVVLGTLLGKLQTLRWLSALTRLAVQRLAP